MSNTATAMAALITALVSGAVAAFSAYKTHQNERKSASAEAIDAESRARQALANDMRQGLHDCREECHQLRQSDIAKTERIRVLEAEVIDLKREISRLKRGAQ